MRWTSPDGEQGKIHPVVAKSFKDIFFGQDKLGQMDAVVTTDHRVFYQDTADEKEAQRNGYNLKWVKEKGFSITTWINTESPLKCTNNPRGH